MTIGDEREKSAVERSHMPGSSMFSQEESRSPIGKKVIKSISEEDEEGEEDEESSDIRSSSEESKHR